MYYGPDNISLINSGSLLRNLVYNHWLTFDNVMLPVRTMAPLTSSKQTSAAASKIKNKILNTSSFFKVSLKTNNKALALALEAQKERSRQLEKEIVYLQKQVEALCFELAAKKYKHRKLLLILKNLHSNTLQHLGMVADLFSDSDLPKLFEQDKILCGDTNKENVVVGSLTDQLPPQPETSETLCPLQKVTADLSEKNTCENIFNIHNRLQQSTDIYNDKTNAEKRHSSQRVQAPQTGTSRPSSSLWDEVERMSNMFSQPGFDMKSVSCLPSSQNPSVVRTCEEATPSLSGEIPLPSGSVMETEQQHGDKQEKTVLLNTTMEMTLSNAAEIVAVETKAAKRRHSGKRKGTKKKEQVCGSSVAENPQVKNSAASRLSEVQSSPTGSLLQTDDQTLEDLRDPAVIELHSSKKCSRVVTSRIPKLTKSEDGNHQKIVKDKFKSSEPSKSKTESCNVVLPDLDDLFTDPEIRFSNARESVKLQPREDAAEEAWSKITCRRSRTKGRRMSSVTRKSFVVLSSHERKSSWSKLEQVNSEVEEVAENSEAYKDQEAPGELLFCADEVKLPESEHVENKSQKKTKTAANSGQSLESRCRGTFVISVADDGAASYRASPEEGAVEQDLMPSPASSSCEAEQSSTVLESGVVRQQSQSSPHRGSDGAFREETLSCKRPWVATQDSENPQEHLSNNDNHEALPLEFQKPKKARREEKSRSSKKKAVQREESVQHLKDGKKKEKSSRSNKEFRSEDEACCLWDRSDASTLRGNDGPDRHKELLDDLQAADLHSDISEKDDIFERLYESKPDKSKSKMEENPKQCRTTSNLHTSTETRNPRETFVVYRGKTQDSDSLNKTRKSNISHTFSHMLDTGDETSRQSLGDLLTDEMPPWLNLDVGTAAAEVDSLLAAPRRATSGRAAVTEPSAAAAASPAGRVLTSLTNTITTPDSETGGRTRRRNGIVSYKEPALNSKIRRGDKFTDSMFLSSPVFKDGKKKKQKKTRTELKPERSSLVD